MSANTTENGCLLLAWGEVDITLTGATAVQMLDAGHNVAVTTLTNAGLMATVTIPDTTTPPTYSNGLSVAISGANDAAFNGYFTIFNASNTAGVSTFSYTMATAPTVVSVQANVGTLKFRLALVQNTSASNSISFGPNSNGTARTIIAGEEYQIPQSFGAFGAPVIYDMAKWYIKGHSTDTAKIIYVP